MTHEYLVENYDHVAMEELDVAKKIMDYYRDKDIETFKTKDDVIYAAVSEYYEDLRLEIEKDLGLLESQDGVPKNTWGLNVAQSILNSRGK